MYYNTIYYQKRNGSIRFKYGFNGKEMTYLYYSLREAYRLSKKVVGVKRAHLEQCDWLFLKPFDN